MANIISEIALTGHLVILQMSAPDVFHVLEELKKIGMEKYLISSVLEGVISQRLVRLICNNCKEEYIPSKETVERYFKDNVSDKGLVLFRGKGCRECSNSGYKGKTGIYEIFLPDTEVKERIALGENIGLLKSELCGRSFQPLREKALECALLGKTTLEEALRVCYV